MSLIEPQEGCAVVTGAGSGLGRALALALCAQGFAVAGLGRRLEALEETQALSLTSEGSFLPVAADVADPQAVSEAFSALRSALGPVALLINNAAVYPRRDFLDEDGASFMHTVAVNLGGTVACTREALDDMAPKGRGRILNVGSFADLAPLPAAGAYSLSKGAGRIFTRTLVADLADRFPGITISDWSPGILATEMGLESGLPPELAAQWGAALARQCDPSFTGTMFEQNLEILPPRSLKAKLRDALLFRKSGKPRHL